MNAMKKNRQWKVRALLMGVADIITIVGSYFLALLLRFDFAFSAIDARFVDGFSNLMLPWCAVTLAVFYGCHLYHSVWSLAGTTELISILKAYLILAPIYYVLRCVLDMDMPRSYYAIGFMVNFCLTTGLRFSDRVLRAQVAGCRLRTIPGIYQSDNNEVGVGNLRDVEIADLLGRDQICVNNDEIFADLKDKTILVTGGGGSIGSELCRQIARAEPAKLIIFDIYENNAYAIQQELKRKFPVLDLVVLIGSVRNSKRIHNVMQTYRPDIVFHAAAHKHVPLMEESPNEAIKNNVMGTYKTAVAAADAGVRKFVQISTDKAVNPTSIMGASKRLCEMVVQMMDRCSTNTSFVAVRFGNVLGSNGSVIPLFKKQIAEGGPITITDKRIIRYFMTISEAVSLVL